MLFRRRLGVVLAVVLLGITSPGAWARFIPKISLGESASIMINGRVALRFRAHNGYLSPEERAQITWQRLCRLRNEGFDPGTVKVQANRWRVRLVADDTVICLISVADATRSGATRLALAERWAANIRTLLSMPAISLSAKQLVVPLGEKRRVAVGGAARGPIYANTDAQAIASVSVGTDGRYVEVTGNQVGNASADICVEGQHAAVEITVKKYAGAMPSICVAKVTGNPCPSSLAKFAAWQIAAQSASMEPGASVAFGPVAGASHGLGINKKSEDTVQVTISGPGYLTYTANAPVEVQNVMMPRDRATQLFYSNDPERITRYQTLFTGEVGPDTCTRVLYHHQNVMHRGVQLIVELINPNSTPDVFRVFGGIASPCVDPVAAGHVAGAGFLRNYLYNASIIEKIPQHSRLILVSNLLGYMDTASGLLQITNMSSDRAYLKIMAQPPGIDNVSRGQVTAVPNALMFNQSTDVYPFPDRVLDVEYVVGGPWAFIPVGKEALDSDTNHDKLFGDYGVIYKINVRVYNPTDKLKTISIVFDPTAGVASGAFIINGKFVVVRSAAPPSDVRLATFHLRPKEMRNITITTLPMAGSNYPANLIVRS